ncbi:DOPA 4,5-dioxygenase family protein [Sphingomonas xanthus]|uniref:Aromatic ring-opening dioxygenase n=1 Tax=Sphingomonas xanthus TaxID=2594473 RepID=A0A516IU09_9SPHN|nr:DOPA 4,5-dioxygenase family protein [Sphingomonas xanthus]QDP20314.1 aromatic ring-opening dioxygenase [Sphingomonas xanthus]
MTDDPPYHAHVYFDDAERAAAEALHAQFAALNGAQAGPPIEFVGRMTDGPVGPHPMPQFEVHFRRKAVDRVMAMIAPTGLRALVHPLTDDDLADHGSLATWIGEPLALDTSVLDPPSKNKGVARFGISDF